MRTAELTVDTEGTSVRGVHRLAGAILLQAIEDIRMRSGKTREEALRWVNDPTEAQFSFVSCCRLLNLHPEDVRKFLEKQDVLDWLFAAGVSTDQATISTS